MTKGKSKPKYYTIGISSETKRMIDEIREMIFAKSYDAVIKYLALFYLDYAKVMTSDLVKSTLCTIFGEGSSIALPSLVKLIVAEVNKKLENKLITINEADIVAEAMKYVKPAGEGNLVTVDISQCRK